MTTLLNFIKKLLKEPFIHFLGLAALLFIADANFSKEDKVVINVDLPTQEYLIKQKQDLILRNLTEQEKKSVVQEFIDEEILLHEAQKKGFVNSGRVRSLLIRNMRYSLTSDIAEPSEEDLKKFYKEQMKRFEIAPSVTYEHLSFKPNKEVPSNMLEILHNRSSPNQLEDLNLTTEKLRKVEERQIVSSFGRKKSPDILNIKDDLWHGPFSSSNGVHFLRVLEHHAGVQPDYRTSHLWLKQEWILVKTEENIASELSALRENYRIVVPQSNKERP